MSESTITQTRKQGEELLSALEGGYYLNYSGLKNSAFLEKIFDSYREFSESEFFNNFNHMVDSSEYSDAGPELLRSFSADMFVMGRIAPVLDKILKLESSLSLKISEKKTPYRSARARILKQSKKRKRDETEQYEIKALEEIIPRYLEARYLMNGASEELGFSNYAELKDRNDNLGLGNIGKEAKQFLQDTEYISREMLDWHFSRHMELPLKDANQNDLIFLLNSFELKGGFPKNEYIVPAARVLDDSGLVNSSDVQAESGKRKGKSTHCMLFLTSPPREMKVSIYPVGGPEDYEAYLSALGSALSFAFTQSDDYFEYRYLSDPAQTELFSALFKNLIFENKWLDRYIDEERDEDFHKLLFLRRLINARHIAGAAIYESILYSGEDSEALKPAYKEIMERALNVQVSEVHFMSLTDTREPMRSASQFKSILIEPNLSSYLKEKYDEEWWRVAPAGSELRELWTQGGRLSAEEITKLSGFNNSAGKLLSIFERELG